MAKPLFGFSLPEKLRWTEVAKPLFGFRRSKSCVAPKCPSRFLDFHCPKSCVGQKWPGHFSDFVARKAALHRSAQAAFWISSLEQLRWTEVAKLLFGFHRLKNCVGPKWLSHFSDFIARKTVLDRSGQAAFRISLFEKLH